MFIIFIDLLGLRDIISDILDIFFDLTLKPLIKYQKGFDLRPNQISLFMTACKLKKIFIFWTESYNISNWS